MMTFRILVAALMTAIELTSSIVGVNYDEKAKEYYEEVQASMDETFSDEVKEELSKRNVIIEEVNVHYERNDNYDDTYAYTFRADVKVNGHTVSEILVVDMKDDEDLEYYGLVDDELLTADSEKAVYYRELLSTH